MASTCRSAAARCWCWWAPSGSGKSTLLKMVSGIESPDEGQVWLSGRDATADPPYRRPVHTVFQNYALFPHLDVAGNVGLSARRRRRAAGQTRARWCRPLSAGCRCSSTPGGGSIRSPAASGSAWPWPGPWSISRSASCSTSRCRPSIRTCGSATLELLQELQSRLQLTYLYITHDRDEALRIGHRIGVLNHGRLEQLGTPEDIYRRRQRRLWRRSWDESTG